MKEREEGGRRGGRRLSADNMGSLQSYKWAQQMKRTLPCYLRHPLQFYPFAFVFSVTRSDRKHLRLRLGGKIVSGKLVLFLSQMFKDVIPGSIMVFSKKIFFFLWHICTHHVILDRCCFSPMVSPMSLVKGLNEKILNIIMSVHPKSFTRQM